MAKRKYVLDEVNRVNGKFTQCIFRLSSGDQTTVAPISRDSLRRHQRDNNKYEQLLSAEISSKIILNGSFAFKSQDGHFYKKHVSDKSRLLIELKCMASLNHVELVKRLPPFSTMIFGNDNSHIYMQKNDVTFESWMYPELGSRPDSRPEKMTYPGGGRDLLLKSPEDFKRVLDGIFSQVVMALKMYQKYVGFVHNDLHTRNICLQARNGSGAMSVVTSEQDIFVFEDDIPLIKIIDAGDSHVNGRNCGKIYGRDTAFFNSKNNSFDLFCFSAALIPSRDPKTCEIDASDSILVNMSTELRDCVLRVVYPDPNSNGPLWFLKNPNAMPFPYLHGFLSPDILLREASSGRERSPLKRFVRASISPAPPDNIFYELQNDGWNHSGEQEDVMFRIREAVRPETMYKQSVKNISQLRGDQNHALLAICEDVINLWKRRMTTRYSEGDIDKLACYGGCDASLRKRVMRSVTIAFQKAMRFYFEHIAAGETGHGTATAEQLLFACLLRASGGARWFFLGRKTYSDAFEKQINTLANKMKSTYDDDVKVPEEYKQTLQETTEYYFFAIRWATNPLFHRMALQDALTLCRETN